MGQHPQGAAGRLLRTTSLTQSVDAAFARAETALDELRRAWLNAEGRRGRISENREMLAQAQAALEKEMDELRREQWRVRKESATLQHALDQVDALNARIAAFEAERDAVRTMLLRIQCNTKVIDRELRR